MDQLRDHLGDFWAEMIGTLKAPYYRLALRKWRYENEIREGLRPPKMELSRKISSSQHRLPLEKTAPHLQTTSKLLSTLPIEIRQQIWRLFFDSTAIHVTFFAQRFRHYRCRALDHESCGLFPWKDGIMPSISPTNLAAMLLVCRQIYLECIPILYSANDLIVTWLPCIEYLPRLFPSHHIHFIRSLRFRWRVGSPPLPPSSGDSKKTITSKLYKKGVWEDTWRIISEMKELRKLYVELEFNCPPWGSLSPVETALVLEPIMRVKVEEEFKLSLPSATDFSKAPWTSLPCTLDIKPDYNNW